MARWTRRAFIATGGLVGGGLLLGVGGFALAPNRLGIRERGDGPERLQPTTWMRLATDGRVTALVPHAEMGQGAHTALAMMLAEELEADWDRVGVEEAPALDEYANGHVLRGFLGGRVVVPEPLVRGVEWLAWRGMAFYGMQITGGSLSVRATGWYGMRVAGAAAREMLVETAAERWGVAKDECLARLSRVTHPASGRSADYGELAAEAARRRAPVHPRLKDRRDYTIVGRPQPRIDVPAKVDGSLVYAADVRLPGMLHAAVRAAPVHGGRLASVDETPARAMAGVRAVVPLARAVAVVAGDSWTAAQALGRLEPRFDDGDGAGASSASIDVAQAAALARGRGRARRAQGDAEAVLARAESSGGRVVEADYRVPFLAHAAIETPSATVRVADGRCEIWTGIQDPLRSRAVAAKVLGVARGRVLVHNRPIGGGFGRRLPNDDDFLVQAVEIARALSPAPVQLAWSREEDLRQDYYRPAVLARLQGAVGADGTALAWVAHCSDAAQGGSALPPYAIPAQRVVAHGTRSHLRTGYWRAVDHTQHGFFVESFVDELARAAGRDPLEFRLALLGHAPRHRAVLERVAALCGWDPARPGIEPAGRGRGVAVVESYGSVVAVVAEVEVPRGAAFRVSRLWAAVDCGFVVNPATAHEQVEGGMLFGLSAALAEEITVREGAVEQTNFHEYPLLRLAEAPAVEIAFVDSDAHVGGLGEPGLPPVAPAVANALHAAIGHRVRRLPLRRYFPA